MPGETYLHFEQVASHTASTILLIPRLMVDGDHLLAGSEKVVDYLLALFPAAG